MKQVLLLLFFAISSLCYGTSKDSVDVFLAEFDSVIHITEYDYSMFKFKVTDKNRKEYTKFRNGIRKDIQKGKRSLRDAVSCFVAWFKDAHLCIEDMDTYEHDTKYTDWIDYTKIVEKYDPQYIYKKVDDNTFLIRFPSCESTRGEALKAIEEYLASGCENLIIDVRGNGGGGDGSIMPFVNLLYNKPGYIPGAIFRNTRNNIESRLQLFRINGVMEELKSVVEFYERIKNVDSEYVEFVGKSLLHRDSVSAYPEKAAIIIDNRVASAAEDLLMYVETTSDRVVRYGKEHTMGAADNGNCTGVLFEKHRFAVIYPTTYNTHLDEGVAYFESGISPQVQIPISYPKILTDNIDEWVLWVAEDLKTRTK